MVYKVVFIGLSRQTLPRIWTFVHTRRRDVDGPHARRRGRCALDADGGRSTRATSLAETPPGGGAVAPDDTGGTRW
jgi:hypothetical protein